MFLQRTKTEFGRWKC